MYIEQFSKKPAIIDLILLIIIPVAILKLNPMISFGNAHHVDAWNYFGYFQMFDQKEMLGVESYRLDRLPALMPGYFLYKFFPPMVAHYSWFFFHYYVVVFSFYFVVLYSIGRGAALIAVIFLCVNRILLGYFSTNYAGVSVLACGFLSLALVMKARQTKNNTSQYFLILSGVVWSMAIISHLKAIMYLFVVPMYYLSSVNIFSPKFMHQKKLREVIFYFGGGFLLCLIILGIFNYFFLDGRFFLFSAIIMKIPKIFNVEATLLTRSFTDWIKLSPAVHFGLITLTCSGYYTFRQQFTQTQNLRFNWTHVFVTVYFYFASAILLYKLSGHAVFRYNKYAWLLLPSYMVLISTVFAYVSVKSKMQYWIIVISILVLGLASSYIKEPTWIPLFFKLYGIKTILLLICAGLAISFFAYNKRFTKIGTIGALLILLIVQCGLTPDNYGRHPFRRYDDPKWGFKVYTRVHEGMAFLRDLHLPERPKFWINNISLPGDAYIYPRSFQDNKYHSKFPKYDPLDRGGLIEVGNIVIIIDNNTDIIDRANYSLSKYQLAVSCIKSKKISFAGVEYSIVVTRVKPSI